MGTVGPDNFSNDPIALAMVRAGAEELREPSQPVTATVSVAEMARRVGVTERTGYNKWDSEDFQIALVREVLELNADSESKLDPETLLDAARDVIADETIPSRMAMQMVFDIAWKSLVDDPLATAVSSLALSAFGEGRVADEIRNGITEVYSNWIKQLTSIVDAFVARNARLISVRQDLSTTEMAMIAMILAEGAARQTRLARSENREAFEPELPGRALQALLGYAIVFHDDAGSHPIDRHLDRLEEPS